MPKLTLSADQKVIDKAKRLAEARGTSVSAMFSQFVNAIDQPVDQDRRAAPITRRLRGVATAPGNLTDRELYERAIQGKAGR